MTSPNTDVVESADLDELVAAAQTAQRRIRRLREDLDAGSAREQLDAAVAMADELRDGVLVRAGAQIAALEAPPEPMLVVDVRDSATDLYGVHRDLNRRIDELRSLLAGLAAAGAGLDRARPVNPASTAPVTGQPERWEFGDVFAEVYR